MSDIIQLLPDHIANQIAAGEVIQRPASVVKELMENAIDAGATKINLVIVDAGKTLIQVIDDGVGMSEQDAQTAFERHATSKLKSADDLFNLHTKGFRGEALASIAAIAHVSLKTKHAEANLGTKVEIEGSKINTVEPDGIAKGSSLSVKNLFFNVPARRNFLKSDNIENKHILEEFKRIALTHSNIAFTLHSNGNEIFNLQATDNLRRRIVDVFGKSFNDKLVPINETTDLIKISGFVVKPEFARKSAGEHYLFVNQRFFKDRYFHHAIKGAFENLIAPNTQPSFFLYFEVNPASIDVNVHPTKTEIKFEEDRAIYAIIRTTVRRSLGLHNIAPTLDFEQETAFSNVGQSNKGIVAPQIKVNPDYNPFNNSVSTPKSNYPKNKITPNKAEWEGFYQISEEKSQEDNAIQFDSKPSKLNAATAQKFHQIFNRYILVQAFEELYWIDQTQASIRTTYDELMQQFMIHPIDVQQLLFPLEKELQVEEKMFWEAHAKQIERVGFRHQWNDKTIQITGVPAFMKESAIDTCVEDILYRLAYQDIDSGDFAHAIILSLAKGNAIKKGKELSEIEMEALVNSLYESKEPMYSPEGKKIIYSQSLDNIINQF